MRRNVQRAVAALGRELRRLERRRDAADHVELAAARELREPRDVDRAQLDRRPRQRAHHRAGVARVGEQPQPGEHVAHLGALEVGGRADHPERAPRAPRGRRRSPAPSSRTERHQHADLRSGAHALVGRSAARPPPPPACACARSERQRQKRTSPPPRPRSGSASARGRRRHHRARRPQRPGAAALRLGALEAHDARVRVLALEVGDVLAPGAAPGAWIAWSSSAAAVDVAVRLRAAAAAERPRRRSRPGSRRRARARSRAAMRARTCGFSVQQLERVQHEAAEVERAARRRSSASWSAYTPANSTSRPACARSASSSADGGEPLARSDGTRRGSIISSFSRSMRASEAREQRRRVAADLVAAQRQVVDPLEQQRQPVGRCVTAREERVEPGLERLVAQQPRAECRRTSQPTAPRTGVSIARLEALAQTRAAAAGREVSARIAPGGLALLHEPGEALDRARGLPGAGAADARAADRRDE